MGETCSLSSLPMAESLLVSSVYVHGVMIRGEFSVQSFFQIIQSVSIVAVIMMVSFWHDGRTGILFFNQH